MTHDEQVVFLSLCKQIRECQNMYGGDVYGHSFAITNINNANRENNFKVKRLYAIAYSLEKKGYVKIDRNKCVTLSRAGMEYVQNLRKQVKK